MTGTLSYRRPIARFSIVALLIIALIVAIAYVGIAIYSAHVLTSPTNHPPQIRLGSEAVRWETVTSDGLTLRGWYLPAEISKQLIVTVHGMKMSWEEMARLGVDLHRAGYAVLLFDLRGHGESDPSRLSMGRTEREDLRAVLRWANQNGFESDHVGWLGYSMGASTILLEALRNQEINAAVLDSPYGDLPSLLDDQLTLHSGLPSFFNPGIISAADHVFGVRTKDLVPIQSAGGWGDRPMLLIHGEADSIVPVEQGRAIAKKVGPACQLVTLSGVEHTEAYLDNPVKYIELVDSFFKNALQ